MILNKLYAAIALVAAIGIGWFYVDRLRAENKQLKANEETYQWTISEYERLAAAEATQAKSARQEKEALKIENDKLSADLNSGVRRVYIKASCPAAAKTDLSGQVQPTYVELDPGVRQDLLLFRARLGDVQSDFNDCKARLKALSR